MATPKFDPSQPFETASSGMPQGGPPKFDPNQPHEFASPQEMSTLSAFGEGAKHALPFESELEGAAASPTGAVQEILNKFLTDKYSTPEVAKYKAARDLERQQLQQAEEQHPYATFGGGLVGSLPLAIASGGLGLGGELAQGAGIGAKALQAAKIGAAGGALYGVGNGTAEDIPGMAKEALTGAATGGVLGGGVSALGSTAAKIPGLIGGSASWLGKETGTTPQFKKGLEGVKTFGKQALEDVGNERQVAAEALNQEISGQGGMGVVSGKYEAAKQGTALPEELDPLLKAAQALPDSDISIKEAKNKIIEAITGTQQEKTVPASATFKTIKPVTGPSIAATQPVAATPSTEEAMLEQIEKLNTRAKLENSGLNSELVKTTSSSGQPMLSIKTTPSIAAEGEELAGPKFSLPKFAEEGTPEMPGTPAIQGQVTTEVTPGTISGNVPSNEPIPGDRLLTLKKNVRDQLDSITNQNKEVQNLRQVLNSTMEEKLPGINAADEARYKIGTILKGIQRSGDNLNEVQENRPLVNLIKNVNDPTRKAEAQAQITQITELLKDINPALAKKFNDTVTSLGEKSQLVKEANQVSRPSQIAMSSLGTLIGHAIGGPVGGAAGGIAGINVAAILPAKGAANLIGYTISKTPQGLKNAAAKVAQVSNAGAALGQKMAQLATKDDIARNAGMFALEQNPDFRKLLRQSSGGSNVQ